MEISEKKERMRSLDDGKEAEKEEMKKMVLVKRGKGEVAEGIEERVEWVGMVKLEKVVREE